MRREEDEVEGGGAPREPRIARGRVLSRNRRLLAAQKFLTNLSELRARTRVAGS